MSYYRAEYAGKFIKLSPEKYRELYENVLNDMVPELATPDQRTLATRLELNGILSLEIMRTLHEISNTLHDINNKL